MAATEFILDASALAKLFLDQVHAKDFRRWYHQEANRDALFLAPPIIEFEIGQILVREHPGPAAGRREFLARALEGVVIDGQATPKGFEYAPPLSFYDAAYLALAKSRRATLVTYDRRLRDAAKAAGNRTLAPGA